MKDINYYYRLPEGISQEEIELEIEELIYNVNKLEYHEFLLALNELSQRQVINYSLINSSIIKKITGIFTDKWNELLFEDACMTLSIIIALGMQDFYLFLHGEVSNIKDKEVLQEVIDVFKEFGSSVEDVSFKY